MNYTAYPLVIPRINRAGKSLGKYASKMAPLRPSGKALFPPGRPLPLIEEGNIMLVVLPATAPRGPAPYVRILREIIGSVAALKLRLIAIAADHPNALVVAISLQQVITEWKKLR